MMDFKADSHELAHMEPDIKGIVDKNRNFGAKDVGWHKPSADIPSPLINTVPNGRLWSMIRRFNEDVFDVRAIPPNGSRGLDLKEAWDDAHAADKLTLNLQRGYLSIILSLASFLKQISRLRSWKESRRTAGFCVAYFAGWIFDMLVPMFLGMLILVITSTEARGIMFPPQPLALINVSTGGMQTPPAGKLGTSNTLTGAPEKQEGEAAEEEAANFVDNLRHVIMRAVGMHENQHEGGDPLEGKVPKPLRNALNSIKDEGSAPGHASETTDQTQEPMEEVIWAKAKPENLTPVLKTLPFVVGEIVDNWERVGNTLSPTPPFSRLSFLRIDAVVVLLFLASFFVNYYVVYKITSFAFYFAMFGDPIITPFRKWLNRRYPKWLEVLDPKNNILRGVPTNSQLTLTLLRIGEVHGIPLPPVPRSHPDDPDQELKLGVDKTGVNSMNPEIKATNQLPSFEGVKPAEESHNEKNDEPKHNHLSKAIRFLKGNTKNVVEAKLAIDHVRASAGSEKAKGHLGVLPNSKELIYAGPSEFKGRLDGKNGWVYIVGGSDPRMLFLNERPSLVDDPKNMAPTWEIYIGNITRLKRAKASSNKLAEKAAAWSGDGQLLGSVEINDLSGKTWRFTALPERDELFNRLVAVGNQRWVNV